MHEVIHIIHRENTERAFCEVVINLHNMTENVVI